MPVDQCAQGLEQWQIKCLDEEGKPMILNHVVKVKFVDDLRPRIRDKVRPIVDGDMKFDAPVGMAEKIQTTSKPGVTHSGPPPRKPNVDQQ